MFGRVWSSVVGALVATSSAILPHQPTSARDLTTSRPREPIPVTASALVAGDELMPRYGVGGLLAPAPGAQIPVEALIQESYQREFGESIPWPAIFNDRRSADCYGNGHLTTTAYLRTSSTTAKLLVLYTTRDGRNVLKRSRRLNIRVPAGTFKIVSIVVRHPDTVGLDPLSTWRPAQQQINDAHAQFARSHGYAAPIVVFDNVNLVLEADDLANPTDPVAARAAAARHRFPMPDDAIVLVINIDPTRGEGGLAQVAQQSIYVGNYGHWTTTLGEREWSAIARTAYHQLMAYYWGWEHDWTPTCGGTQLGHEPFITSPTLLGWEDLDGDGVPEILDDTPYGRSR
jgi:hypothetical protein